MADGIVQVAPDSTGKKVDATELTVNSQTVERQRVNLADPSAAAGLASVLNTAPASEYGLVTRNIPSGTQTIQGIQDAATTGNIVAATSVVGPLAVASRNVITVSIHGTYAGIVFIIEASDDSGTTWYPLQCINNSTGQAGSTWTPGTNGVASYDAAVGGYTHVRVRATAWTSGTGVVLITGQAFAYDPVVAALAQGLAAVGATPVGSPVLMGGQDSTPFVRALKTDANGNSQVRVTDNTNFLPTMDAAARRGYVQLTDGTSAQAVKAASTAAAAADIAAVVSLSPNSPLPATTLAAQALTNVNINASGALAAVKASAGNLFGFSLQNNTAAVVFVEFWNVATGSVTLGTTTPTCVFAIPASSALTVPPGLMALLNSGTAISFAAVTAYNGSTTASVTGSIFFK